jgi:hypothetical protein
MAKMGPKGPMKYTPDFLEELTVKFNAYIDRTTIPFIKEFCFENNLNLDCIIRDCVSNSKDFKEAYHRLKYKQEVNLVRATLMGKTNPAMAIFCLKNVSGWRDQPAEENDDEMKNRELEFAGVEKRHSGQHRFARFYN